MGQLLTSRILIGLLLAAATVAQDRPAKSAEDGNYYPLAEDASWRYRDTGGTEDKALDSVYTCLGRVAVKGGTCFELSYRRGNHRNYEYWSSGKGGVFRFHRGYLGGWRGVSRDREPQRILAGPVGATLTWEWTETGSVQTMAGTPQPDPETLKILYRARIEEMQDKVKVPAGEFDAVRVRITSKGFSVSDTTWWFAKGIGPVKRLEKGYGDNVDRVFELVQFVPGIDVRETAKETAARFFVKNPPGTLTHMKQRFLSDHFRNQFFLARFEGRTEPTFLRVRRGIATPFDPARVEHWRDLLKDEGIRLTNEPLGFGNADQAALNCAKALALFVGELQGPKFKPYLRSSDFVVSIAFREKTISVKGQVRSGSGGTHPAIPVLMKFDTSTVTQIQSRGLPNMRPR